MIKIVSSHISVNYMNRFMHTHSKTVFNKRMFPLPHKPPTPILFDVSLRDGIQGANPLDFPTFKKMKILQEIHQQHNPAKLEIGSFVSPKVLPIMSDTSYFFETIPNSIKGSVDIYVLVPNKIGLLNAIKSGFTNFSFITSVSNDFQMKNTGKNLLHNKTELQAMMNHVANLDTPSKTKLYVSCVNECPIFGLIDRDMVVHEILSSYGRNDSYDEICLSDTMGTLKCRNFEYIVDGLIRFGIAASRISVHLHINRENEREAKHILFACFRRNINRFDVSNVLEGGCSVTMDSDKLKPNMTYAFFNAALEEYKSM